MVVDATVHNHGAANHCVKLARFGQLLGHQRNFKGTGDFNLMDAGGRYAERLQLACAGIAGLVHDIAVPVGADDGDAGLLQGCVGSNGVGHGLIHGLCLHKREQQMNQGARRQT